MSIETKVDAGSSFATSAPQPVELQPKLKASGMRPDSDSSSMMGFDEHGRFDPFSELPAPAAKAPALNF